MSNHLHTVAITGDEDSPRIEFTCRAGRAAECHSYPDCMCESWVRGDHEHPFVSHDECWMKSWFDNADNGGIEPMPEFFADCDISIGDSGPISTACYGEYIEWEFVTEAASA